ncbi:MAG: alanine racemase [Hyphomicrobiales bacterium]|nr:MAG: alanine racemase [Hyphomicrobiales bacterium]
MPAQNSDRPDLSGFAGFEKVLTPAVVLNGSVMRANIARMQALAEGRVALHPHIKTHKSIELARRQIAAGAAGVTASRAAEARHFIVAGIPVVTVAYPIIDADVAAELTQLAARHDVLLRFVVDSEDGVAALTEARKRTGCNIQALIEVDVGLKRCGIDPHSDEAITLAARLAAGGIDFIGLLSHAGQSYGAAGAAQVADIAATERGLLRRLGERLVSAGFAPATVSVGSTPTALCNAGFEGLTELRPGNYIFLDLTAVRLGIASRQNLALAVVSSVISVNDRYAIIDAGSKTLSSDMGPHGTGAGAGFGEAWLSDGRGPFQLEKLSEEHGFVGRASGGLEVGSKLLVLPNHACPVVNLASSLFELFNDGIATIPIEA